MWRTGRTSLRLLYRRYASQLSEEELDRLQARLKGSRSTLISPDKDVHVPNHVPNKRALVILMGWTSGSLKAVAKHSTPYAKVGIPAVCVAPSVFQMWSNGLGSRLARPLLQSIDDALQEPVSVVLHGFSGSTSVVLPLMVADFESGERKLTRKLNPACIVFDSGPTAFTYETGMAAAKQMQMQGGYSYPTYLAAICVGITVNFLVGKKRNAELDRMFQSPLFNVPQLYLHSELDAVVTPSRVQQVMQDQQDMGRDVSSHCWKDSQHVRLYLNDPETYEYHVHTLLRKCSLL